MPVLPCVLSAQRNRATGGLDGQQSVHVPRCAWLAAILAHTRKLVLPRG